MSQTDHTAPPLFFIFFVADPRISVPFYRTVLGREPIEASETFAMFSLANGATLGLWSPTSAAPPAAGAPGCAELCFVMPTVDATHAAWVERGVPIVQPPTDMDFGRTFTAVDPDGHRIRVFWPAEAAA
jgi:predicted enzyme related to lactoylglutathione lyase